MIFVEHEVIPSDQLQRVHQLLKQADFEDGSSTAAPGAAPVKANHILGTSRPQHRELNQLLMPLLMAHEVITLGCQIKALLPLRIAKYGVGMSYGLHVDDPVMGSSPMLRTDLSITLFLDPPDDYDGGELVLHGESTQQSFKLPAGSTLLYPSTWLHEVKPVTRGVRHVGLTWAQSLVRSPERREILYDLHRTRIELLEREGKTPLVDRLSRTCANLSRLWIEP